MSELIQKSCRLKAIWCAQQKSHQMAHMAVAQTGYFPKEGFPLKAGFPNRIIPKSHACPELFASPSPGYLCVFLQLPVTASVLRISTTLSFYGQWIGRGSILIFDRCNQLFPPMNHFRHLVAQYSFFS
jgi:hypothetical protein